MAYGIRRTLDNPLTFAWINLRRQAGGAYVQLHNASGPWTWSTGIDLRLQRDSRQTFNNNNGQQGDEIRLNQRERVLSMATFATGQMRLSPYFGLTTGLRIDGVQFDMTDYALDNGDQSGRRDFTALSYSVGGYILYRELTTYLNLSTAFETPTTTELINSPIIDGGFNTDLGPQHILGVEIGTRGHLKQLRIQLDLAAFHLRIMDRLVPQQTEDGRTWYRNEGRNRHQGLEAALRWPVNAPIYTEVAYNYSRFIFLNNPGNGLRVPGIPEHHLQASIHARISGDWMIELATEYASGTWADQTNETRSEHYTVVDLYLARDRWNIGRLNLSSFVRIQNLFNALFSNSLVVNAFGGRFFEPAPERAIQIGLSVAL